MLSRCVRVIVLALVAQFLLPVIPGQAAPTWTEIYRTTQSARDSNNINIFYSGGYEYNGTAVTNFQNSGAAWDLIRIRIQFTLTSGSQLYYSDVYFDRWPGATLSDLQFPDYRNSLVLNQNVSNIVVDSNYSAIKTGKFALGRIHFWPYNYAGQVSGLTPVGDSNTYDWDDTPSVVVNGHGSYQLFNLTDTQTVFAWNMHRYNGTQELGMGPNNSGTGAPDWTSNSTTWNNTNFKVQVFVGLKLTTGTVSAPSFSGTLKKGVATTLTATANGPGRITFFFQGKRIANCINRTLVDVSGTLTATCSYKPSTSAAGVLTAQYNSNDTSSYSNATSAAVKIQANKRTNTR
ncbi:MAG: hypothetical protein RLZZ277_247 [Actinomycetota bacterium]|jgi:hypothetical protein